MLARAILKYLAKVLPSRSCVNIFVNSHRDADHMRGVKRVHAAFPIKKIWDSGVTGETTDSSEYREYMVLRREVGSVTISAQYYWDFGKTRIRVMNAKNDDLPDDANAQSIVMKVQHYHPQNGNLLESLMLTGDTDAPAWKKSILQNYHENDLRSAILLGSHHGSITFFDDPADERNYFTEHIKKIKPAMTVISVGPNPHGHPESKALELYEKYSSGSDKGSKLCRTDQDGTIKLVLKDEGGWSLNRNQ